MVDLVKTNESGRTWYPVSIDDLDSLLLKAIQSGHGYQHIYALTRNIAYNLQYIEFLHRCLQDIKLSSVLTTQTRKIIILIGCSIIESLLHYLLIRRRLYTKIEWGLKTIMPGNQKNVDGVPTKVDSHVYTKLSTPKAAQMTFDAMIKKAKSNKLLGSDRSIYTKLDSLRKLRNKVHLQAINEPTDTDWNSFGSSELSDMAELLYKVFTSNIFRPSSEEREYFDYLTEYF